MDYTLVVKVKGMVCAGCENRIKNALKNLDGVKEVDADHKKGQVTVTADSKVDKNIIYKKIENLDFEIEID